MKTVKSNLSTFIIGLAAGILLYGVVEMVIGLLDLFI